MKLESSFNINADLVITPAQLRKIYMWGVSVKDGNGIELPDETYEFFIKAAQQEIEDKLNLKLRRQIIKETRDWVLDDYRTWGFVRLSYPVCRAFELVGKFGETEQIKYPEEWLVCKKSNDVPEMNYRNVWLVPNVGGYESGSASGVTFNGIFGSNLLWRSRDYIPNYWHVRYLTGFSKIPADIMNVIGMTAAINVFHIAGDLILGAGIASFSLGVDSLSQSISSTSSATNAGYGARVLGYQDQIKAIWPSIQARYCGFNMTVL